MADTITSPEFRKRYPRLTEPVIVTALGRPIGAWFPQGTRPSQEATAVAVAERRAEMSSVSTAPAAAVLPAHLEGVETAHFTLPVQRVSPDAYRKVARRPKA